MKKIKLEVIDWEHTCDDGCCTSWGTDVKINGEKVVVKGDDNYIGDILSSVLEHLGYEVDFTGTYS